MAAKLQRRPSSFVPKKGKLRSALERPASTKSKDYMSVKYVRIPTAVGARGRRQEQTKWRRTLPEFLSASNDAIVKMLTKDQILLDWKGRQCPRCERGTLSGLRPCYEARPHLLEVEVQPLHMPALPESTLPPPYLHRMPRSGRPEPPAPALLLKLTDASNAQAHNLLGINHKALEDMDQKLMALRKDFVEERQKTMKIGDGVTWIDVEGDEATFNKSSTGDVDVEKAVKWEQWLGLVERGRPESLILHRLNPPETVKRAPGPGAARKTEWLPLANKYLKDRAVIFHTDSARSYRVLGRWGSARQCGSRYKACPSQRQVDLEGSIICEGDTPQSSWSLEAHQDEGRNSNHRQRLAFYEGSDFPQPALRSRQSAGEGEGPECPVPVLEADGGPLGRDWEALFVGHAQAGVTHFRRQASRGTY